MLLRLAIAVVVIAIVWTAMAHYRRQNKTNKKKLALQYAVIGVSGFIILLAIFGRLHWISAILAGIAATTVRFLPLLARIAPLFAHLYQQKKSTSTSSGNKSTVQSDYLKVVLDHDSESIQGEIINGPHSGKTLDSLTLPQLQELLEFYGANDNDSLQLLMAYVQRQYPNEDWVLHQREEQSQRQNTNLPTEMTRREALEILGLQDDADTKQIKTAHKQLMQRLHPDRGGSPYLAAKVNAAKDFLLK